MMSKALSGWDKSLDAMATGVLISAVLMNALLAIVNAHFFQLNNLAVVVLQLLITATAMVIAIFRYRKIGIWFPVAAISITVFNLLTSINHMSTNFKGLYDALILPIFIALGATVSSFPRRAFYWLFGATYLFATLETFAAPAYVAIFEPLSYLSSTREWVADAAAGKNLDSGLYVGAARAGGQAFSFISDHRVGSIFLEPISLGYFSLIYFIAAQYMFPERRIGYWFTFGACIVLSLVADSRIPSALILACAIIGLLDYRWRTAVRALVPVLVFTAAATLHYTGVADRFGEFGYRIAYTFDALDGSPIHSILLGGVDVGKQGDSGFGQLIFSNGLFGALISIAAASGLLNSRWRHFSTIPVCVSLYAITALLFGGALFSIKTAALLGFLLGVAGRASLAPRPQEAN